MNQNQDESVFYYNIFLLRSRKISGIMYRKPKSSQQKAKINSYIKPLDLV